MKGKAENEGAVRFVSLACDPVDAAIMCEHDSHMPPNVVAAQGNKLRAAGAEALRPALFKLPKLTRLYLYGT